MHIKFDSFLDLSCQPSAPFSVFVQLPEQLTADFFHSKWILSVNHYRTALPVILWCREGPCLVERIQPAASVDVAPAAAAVAAVCH